MIEGVAAMGDQGDNRLSPILLSQTKDSDLAGVQSQQLEGENLVNVPIELPSSSGIFKDVSYGNQPTQNRGD